MALKPIYYLDFIGCDYRVPFYSASDSKLDVYKAALEKFSLVKANDIREEEKIEDDYYEDCSDEDEEEYADSDYCESVEMQILRVANNLIESVDEVMEDTNRGFIQMFKDLIDKEKKNA